jgi:thiaminase/transcriptional activator TenA
MLWKDEMLHEILWQQNARLAEACLDHPFVRGLADGTLDPEVFRRFVAQDAFFLNAFARAYALSAARSHDTETLKAFCELLNGVLGELQLHAAYAEELKIDLAHVQPYPQVKAYTDFLLAIAWGGRPGDTIAAMTPCMRLYAYLGTMLAKTVTPGNMYQQWIDTYSSPEFQALVTHLESLLDTMVDDTPAAREAYAYAMQCELNFFSAMF